MKASPEAQQRLLELADVDAELSRLEHRRRTLPEIAEADQITARDRALHDEIVAVDAAEKDLAREQGKAEADVDQVRTRIDRDRARLDSGQVSSARDLETLQSEIVSLARRQSDLEEIVLDVMERREAAQSRHEALTAERAALAGQLEAVAGRWDAALAEIAEEAGKAQDRRAGVTAEEPADPPALYEKLRAQHGGTGRPHCAAAGARVAICRQHRDLTGSAPPPPTRCCAARSAAGSWSAPPSPGCELC